MVAFLPPDHGHFALVLIKRAHRQMLCKIAAMGAPFSVRDYFNRGRISSQAPRSTILPAMKPFHVEAQAASVILPISRRSLYSAAYPRRPAHRYFRHMTAAPAFSFIILRHDDACK